MQTRHLLFLIAVIVAACSGSDGVATTSSAVVTSASSSTTQVTAPSTSFVFEEVAVEVAGGANGPHLVDEQGRSLYLFTLDDERTSTCENACAETWPPLLGDPVAGEGVDRALLGNAERGDGSIQVTYAGHPLYRYTGDVEPGDTAGHGFNDVWFLVAPDGEPIS